MDLNDLLVAEELNPRRVIVLRHRPHEAEFRTVLPWLAAERPDLFNAYQQTQGPRLEKAMEKLLGSGLIASFIGHEPGKALFVGLYRINAARPLTRRDYWQVAAHVEMADLGMAGWSEPDATRRSILWFDLVLTDLYEDWKGKLIIEWPPPERSWWRRAHRNEMPVLAILEDSALASRMPDWTDIELSWTELKVLPKHWKEALAQWRGIYYIHDASDRMGYVGSASGENNILGRWMQYAATGHGGNVLLRGRDPNHFRFTILQRVSPDMEVADVANLEASWKKRLHTRHPDGLNDN